MGETRFGRNGRLAAPLWSAVTVGKFRNSQVTTHARDQHMADIIAV